MSQPAGARTEDALLNGRVRLLQPANGLRVAIDPIFLAAAVPAAPNQSVLDIGCGSGAASLCLAARVTQCRVAGLELQPELVRIFAENAALNGMEGRVSAVGGDLLRPPACLAAGTFDHVMANPPFIERGRGSPLADPAKAAATIEGDAGLADWVRFALAMVRAKGTVTFIHRADRIDTLLAELSHRAGEVTIFPLWPSAGKPAARVLVRARKQAASPARLLPGLALHEADGRFTAAAEAVLRDGTALPL